MRSLVGSTPALFRHSPGNLKQVSARFASGLLQVACLAEFHKRKQTNLIRAYRYLMRLLMLSTSDTTSRSVVPSSLEPMITPLPDTGMMVSI